MGHLSESPRLMRVGLCSRLCAVACYLGLGPLCKLARRRNDPFFNHHAAQAAVFWLLLVVIAFVGFAYLAGMSAMIIYARGLYERIPNFGGLAPPQRDGLPVTAAVLVAEHFQWALFTAPRLIRGGTWPER